MDQRCSIFGDISLASLNARANNCQQRKQLFRSANLSVGHLIGSDGAVRHVAYSVAFLEDPLKGRRQNFRPFISADSRFIALPIRMLFGRNIFLRASSRNWPSEDRKVEEKFYTFTLLTKITVQQALASDLSQPESARA